MATEKELLAAIRLIRETCAEAYHDENDGCLGCAMLGYCNKSSGILYGFGSVPCVDWADPEEGGEDQKTRTTKTPSVIPQDRSVTISAVAACFPDVYTALIGAPLKWWQRLYIWLRWGRKIRKAEFVAARGLSKTRMTFKRQFGFDPFDLTEDENAEEET